MGTRMRSAVPKVLHAVGGLPLVEHVVRLARTLDPASITLVVGHRAEMVQHALSHHADIRFVVQEPQLGTGHALLQAGPVLAGASGILVLLSGDVPMLTSGTLRRLIEHHAKTGAAATLVTAVLEDPEGYGRIQRRDGRITAVVEHRDASPEERRIREINSGIYAFDLEPLFEALGTIGSANAQGEYYLPDLVTIYRRRGLVVETVTVENPDELAGVNSRKDLAEVATMLRTSRNEALMASGVTLVDPATAYIGPDVTIGPDTVIHPNVHLEGRTAIGSGCEIQPNVRIVGSTLADGVFVNSFCLVVDATVAAGARIGPFAHLRPGSHVGEQAHIGNFVELKKTSVGRGSKANHLAYLGDATIGDGVNIGAGTITCNYDGTHKHQTIIEDGAFIGSDSQLIAPVRVGRGAYVAAGSSITEDVPEGALAVARGRQVNKAGWADAKRRKS
jgi:bifunctional UDP-N-acetylglucosamine pyrophosphorylase / glucosamine-1-phosphate N-acetyltransferase